MGQRSRPAATTLVFIRHGHVADNDHGRAARLSGWFDAPLSELGRAQAERLRARFLADPAEALYSSPLRRARDTAEILAGGLGLPPRLLDDLKEICCGRLDGLPLAEVQRRYPELWRRNLAQADERFSWPGGESYRGFRERVLRAVRTIAAGHPGGRVAVVTHAGAITQVLGSLHGLSTARWSAFLAGNGSLTEVRWAGATGTLVRFDVRDHLREALPSPGEVGPPDHPQVVAHQAGGVGPGRGGGAAPAVRDDQVIA